jgi:hypothetical protein
VLVGGLGIGYQFLAARGDGGLVGNYVAPTGAYSVTVAGTPPTVIPAAAWSALTVLGLVGLLALFVLVVLRAGGQISSWIARESRPSMPTDWGRTLMLFYCVAASGLLIAVKLFTTAPLFDRYLISLIPFTIALGLRAALDQGLVVRPNRVVGVAAIGAFALFGIGMVDNTATFDGLKWRLAQSVQDLGYAPETIDGGYEWFGLHQPDDIDPHLYDVVGNFWLGLFNDPTVCVTSRYADPGLPVESDVDPTIVSERHGRSLVGVDYHLVAVAVADACPSLDRDGD